MKLLIAEDDATSRMILTAVCEEWGYDVTAVEDGLAAWNVLQQETPPLLIIDWEMPNMNGIELCQKIRQRNCKNPPYIILLTSRTSTKDIVEGLQKGANDYVAKPFVNEELQVRMSVGKRVLALQSEVHEMNALLNDERGVIEDIVLGMKDHAPFDKSHIRDTQIPVEKTSGDVLFAASSPDGAQHIMLGDFTGHGITAALGGPIASNVFYKMTAKGLPMTKIGRELNQHMCDQLPVHLFLGAILFEINPERTRINIWNCGMESILFFRDGAFQKEIKSNGLALGINNGILDNKLTLNIQPNDRFYAFSDGIIETINADGEMYGQERLINSITSMLSHSKDIKTLEEEAKTFRNKGPQLDDLTIVELTC